MSNEEEKAKMAWNWVRTGAELKADLGDPVCARAWAAIRDNADWWAEHFEDSVEQVSGWGHNYVCPACAAQLAFDRTQPEHHACPACAKVAPNTREIREAWVYRYRYELAEGLVDAAIAARVLDAGDSAADGAAAARLRAFIRDTIGWYAERYGQFDEHGQFAGRGKIMGQSLDEAVWGIKLLRALSLAGFDRKSDRLVRIYRLMFLPMARLVVAQSGMIHNIPLWHVSFATITALLFDDEMLLRQSMQSALGARRQVLEGFTPDGIWYENSTTYHFYSLEAATLLYAFAKEAGHADEEPEMAARIRDAYLAFLRLVFRDGSLPSFNDGWKATRGLSDRAGSYLAAARLFPEAAGELMAACTAAGDDADGATARARWLFGAPAVKPAPATPASAHLPSNCMVLLRAPGIEVYAKYGNVVRSHAHPDALQICIPPLSMDPGTTGYASALCREWYRMTAAHSTFVVDGANQSFAARGTATLSDDGGTLAMSVADAYDGVAAARTLRVEGNTLHDLFECTCEKARTVDWFFHGAGVFEAEGTLSDATFSETGDGYQYLRNARLWSADAPAGTFRCSWTLADKRLTLSLDPLPPGAVVYVFETPDNPAIETRRTVMVRGKAARVVVGAKYEME